MGMSRTSTCRRLLLLSILLLLVLAEQTSPSPKQTARGLSGLLRLRLILGTKGAEPCSRRLGRICRAPEQRGFGGVVVRACKPSVLFHCDGKVQLTESTKPSGGSVCLILAE